MLYLLPHLKSLLFLLHQMFLQILPFPLHSVHYISIHLLQFSIQHPVVFHNEPNTPVLLPHLIHTQMSDYHLLIQIFYMYFYQFHFLVSLSIPINLHQNNQISPDTFYKYFYGFHLLLSNQNAHL